MKNLNARHIGLVLALLALDSCTLGPRPSTTQNAQPPTASREISTNRLTLQIPASDARFRYEGRFDFADTNAPVVVWQASRISLDFEGDTLGLQFDDAKGQ